MKFLPSRRFFTLWVGVGVPPFFFAMAVIGFKYSLWFGVVNIVVMAAWTIETFSTTCRRCAFYGTGKCGLPGLVVPMLFNRLAASTIPRRRIRLHYYIDLSMILYVNIFYALLGPIYFPAVLIGSVVTLIFVFHEKRFHGLLHRIRVDPITKVRSLSLPVLKTSKTAR